MPDKGADGGSTPDAGVTDAIKAEATSRAVPVAALMTSLATEYGVRTILRKGWKQVTGKEPPGNPQDPRVDILPALTWAILLGVTMETTRLLVMRFVTRKARQAGLDDTK